MKLKKLTLLLTILLFAVSAVTAQEPKEKPTVIVLPFGVENVEQSVIETLFEVFTNELAGTGKAKQCYVTFLIGNKHRSFRVSEFSYHGFRNGETGTLKYRGDRLIDFS